MQEHNLAFTLFAEVVCLVTPVTFVCFFLLMPGVGAISVQHFDSEMKVTKGKFCVKVLRSMFNKQEIKSTRSAVSVVSMIKIMCMSRLCWQLFLTLISAKGLYQPTQQNSLLSLYCSLVYDYREAYSLTKANGKSKKLCTGSEVLLATALAVTTYSIIAQLLC